MKKEVAEKWADVLESGNYKQTEGALHRNDDGYCCLGVLCELAISEGVNIPVTLDFENGKYAYAGNSGFPPDIVLDWAGLGRYDGQFRNNPDEDLSSMNDRGMTFSEIASTIRENWMHL